MGLAKLYRSWRRRRLYSRCLSVPSRTFLLRYHSIAPPEEAARYLDPALAVTPQRFQEQLAILAERAEFVTPVEILEDPENRSGRCRVAITLDDGFVDNFTWALPIIKNVGARASFFVTTAPLLAQTPFWISELWRLMLEIPAGPVDIPYDEGRVVPRDPQQRYLYRRKLTRWLSSCSAAQRNAALDALASRAETRRGEGLDGSFMTPAQLLELKASGMLVGAHTRTHPHLDRVVESDHAEEVAGSKTDLEMILGQPVEHFAYPNPSGGRVPTATARAAVSAAGFRTAVTSIPEPFDRSSDLLRLPRLGVYAGDQEQILFRLIEQFLPRR